MSVFVCWERKQLGGERCVNVLANVLFVFTSLWISLRGLTHNSSIAFILTALFTTCRFKLPSLSSPWLFITFPLKLSRLSLHFIYHLRLISVQHQCHGHGRVELYLYLPSGPHRACNGINLSFLLVQRHRSMSSERSFWKSNLKPLRQTHSPFPLRITLSTFAGSISTPAARDATGTQLF